MVLYETKSRFYLVGSNNTQTKFRVLKIDRTEPKQLVIHNDNVEYTSKEIRDMLTMIEHGNKSKPSQKGNSGLIRTVSAFGILGFVMFLEGYYIILITKRRRLAVIGQHSIYKIEETSMIYIPNDTVRYVHPDESRYSKMFQNVDLASNFYFSYSYDLTHTLQYNLTVARELVTSWQEHVTSALDESSVIGVRWKPYRKFTWNNYLLKDVEANLHPDWLLYIIHGYIEQSNISVFGRPIFVTLIARRSNKFAGTRFLKRGCNPQGHVANEVETEQIVFDCSVSDLLMGHFTSVVQTRGSIPFFWSQDISKMVPKPPIFIEKADPCCLAAGRHFNRLLSRYGSPIIILNLVKKREKKRHESMLSDEYIKTLEYLNQFLSVENKLLHIGFDMARVNKTKKANVLTRLAHIALSAVKRTGIFETRRKSLEIWPHIDQKFHGMQGVSKDNVTFQTGIIRVNCVDCLDRTNTAQFAIGKVALAFQMFALGVLDKPELQYDSDCVRMLEEMYEGHGDTLALQYGGSQLVHRIKTYRKTAPWTSQSRDIMHTLSRYYSNTFSDADKQNAINLFLGVFKPVENKPSLWDLTTDYYLHHQDNEHDDPHGDRSLTQWWATDVDANLPLPCEQVSTWRKDVEIVTTLAQDEKVDGYLEFYRPYELSVLSELFSYTMSHSVRDVMPNFTTDFSPFSVRVRPGKRREEMGVTVSTNPSVTGHSSTSSTASTASSNTSSSTDSDGETSAADADLDDDLDNDATSGDTASGDVTFEMLLPSMAVTYGVEVIEPAKSDISLYKKYEYLGKCLSQPDVPTHRRRSFKTSELTSSPTRSVKLIRQSAFTLDSSENVSPPTVNRKCKDVYRVYVQRGLVGAGLPAHQDMVVYQRYVARRFQ